MTYTSISEGPIFLHMVVSQIYASKYGNNRGDDESTNKCRYKAYKTLNYKSY